MDKKMFWAPAAGLAAAFLAAGALSVATSGRSVAGGTPAPDSATIQVSAERVQAARTAIGSLNSAVGTAPAGFDPALFGDSEGHNEGGCGSVDAAVARDASTLTYRLGSDCAVASAAGYDPYTLEPATGLPAPVTFDAASGQAPPTVHIITPRAAWDAGASSWDEAQRQRFAVDTDNLLTVSAPTATSKADKVADGWMPANRGAWCDYSVRVVHVAERYRLDLPSETLARLNLGLSTCQNR